MKVRTRFAPSPTGVLHIGSVRTALFSWLFARRHGGTFILRIEDTDAERSTPANVDAIMGGLAWIGLDADEGPIFQTDRYDRYREVIEQWLQDGHAYRCYCSKEELAAVRERQMSGGGNVRYNGRCRERTRAVEGAESVVRFRNPQDGQVIVNDLVRGRVAFQNSQLDDLIIARSDGSPTYNFTVIVDDLDMDVTHVIRGDDHLNNTPRQMNMFRVMGADMPAFAHLPMILGADGAKLSKRHGAVDIRDYQEQGYLPEAMLNYLVRLGWSHGDQEIFTIDEMIRLFDVADVNQSASTFNADKLRWVNQQHIMKTPIESLGRMLLPYLERAGLDTNLGPDPTAVATGFKERAETLVELAESARYCYQDFIEIEPSALKKQLRPVILEPLIAVKDRLENLSVWGNDEIAAAIVETAEQFEIKMGKLGQPLRVAITGGSVSPPIDVTLGLVGRERSLARLNHAIALVEERKATS